MNQAKSGQKYKHLKQSNQILAYSQNQNQQPPVQREVYGNYARQKTTHSMMGQQQVGQVAQRQGGQANQYQPNAYSSKQAMALGRKQSLPSSFAQQSVPLAQHHSIALHGQDGSGNLRSHKQYQVPAQGSQPLYPSNPQVQDSMKPKKTQGMPSKNADRLADKQGVIVGKGNGTKTFKSHAKYFSQQNSPVNKQKQIVINPTQYHPQRVQDAMSNHRHSVSHHGSDPNFQLGQQDRIVRSNLDYQNTSNPSMYTIHNSGGQIHHGIRPTEISEQRLRQGSGSAFRDGNNSSSGKIDRQSKQGMNAQPNNYIPGMHKVSSSQAYRMQTPPITHHHSSQDQGFLTANPNHPQNIISAAHPQQHIKQYHSINQGPIISNAAGNQTVATNASLHSMLSNNNHFKSQNMTNTNGNQSQASGNQKMKSQYEESFLNGPINVADQSYSQSMIEDTIIAASGDQYAQNVASLNAKRYMHNNTHMANQQKHYDNQRQTPDSVSSIKQQKIITGHQRAATTITHYPEYEMQRQAQAHFAAHKNNPKFVNHQQSIDKIQSELFARHIVNPSNLNMVSNDPRNDFTNQHPNQNDSQVKIQTSMGTLGVKNMRKHQKAQTRPASNKKQNHLQSLIQAGDNNQPGARSKPQGTAVPSNMEVSKFDIKTGVPKYSKTNANSLTRQPEEEGKASLSKHPSQVKSIERVGKKAKRQTPTSFVVPQNQMLKPSQILMNNQHSNYMQQKQYIQSLNASNKNIRAATGGRASMQSHSSLNKFMNLNTLNNDGQVQYQHVKSTKAVNRPGTNQDSSQTINAQAKNDPPTINSQQSMINANQGSGMRQPRSQSKFDKQPNYYEIGQTISASQGRERHSSRRSNQSIKPKTPSEQSLKYARHVEGQNLEDGIDYNQRIMQKNAKHQQKHISQMGLVPGQKIHRATTRVSSTNPNSKQNSSRKHRSSHFMSKSALGFNQQQKGLQQDAMDGAGENAQGNKYSNYQSNYRGDNLAMGPGGMIIQQPFSQQQQQNLQQMENQINSGPAPQQQPYQPQSNKSQKSINTASQKELQQQQSQQQQNNLLIVQIFQQKGLNYKGPSKINNSTAANNTQKMMKYKMNANGVIIHTKGQKGGALTTSANTANNTAHNSPRTLAERRQSYNNQQMHGQMIMNQPPQQQQSIRQSQRHQMAQQKSARPAPPHTNYSNSRVNASQQIKQTRSSKMNRSSHGSHNQQEESVNLDDINTIADPHSGPQRPNPNTSHVHQARPTHSKHHHQPFAKVQQVISEVNQGMKEDESMKYLEELMPEGPLITEEEEHEIRQVASDINEKAFFGKILKTKQILTASKRDSSQLRKLSPRSQEIAYVMKKIDEAFSQKKPGPPETELNFYRIGKMLGRGAFGKVNLAMHKLVRKLVALKSLNKECLTDEVQKKKLMKEVNLLLKLRHDHVVKIYETIETKKHIIIVMELCAGGDLLNYVRKRRRLKEPYAKKIFKQIIDGLDYIHSKHVAHRDIKLDNILLDGKGSVKIADFGVSKQSQPGLKMREQCGTPAYIAPEILKNKNGYSFNVDLWSAGVVLYAMLYGTVPFKAASIDELHTLILRGIYTLKDDISQEARDMLRGLLEINPYKRLTIQQILSHPWLADYDENLELFNDQEREMIKKEYTYNDPSRFNRNENEDPVDCFTEHNIDSVYNTLKNVSDKSVILAPFNSTQSEDPEVFRRQIQTMILDKQMVLRLSRLCREVDRQYEFNNNGQLDNGVYHKQLVNSEIKSDKKKKEKQQSDDEEDDELKFQVVQCSKSQGMEFDTEDYEEMDEDKKKKSKKEFIKNMLNNLSEAERQLIESTFGTNKEMEIDDSKVDKLVQYGYPREYVTESLQNNEANYLTAGYYLLKMDQNYC